MGAKVRATRSASAVGRKRIRGVIVAVVARACWTFLNVARWPRMEGHLMARERSRRRRHAVPVGLYSAGS